MLEDAERQQDYGPAFELALQRETVLHVAMGNTDCHDNQPQSTPNEDHISPDRPSSSSNSLKMIPVNDPSLNVIAAHSAQGLDDGQNSMLSCRILRIDVN
jgi:hypothetical protein